MLTECSIHDHVGVAEIARMADVGVEFNPIEGDNLCVTLLTESYAQDGDERLGNVLSHKAEESMRLCRRRRLR
ncbi:hypothetical protein [Stenotrophomonas phage A1432]|uniref:Uncharacterized protein n=1 Tax=Stenotrophomonas phage A1432 TaxID=2930315 RepID=A0A9E7N405_9CAUD|nr:hypothetical protein P9A45_gp68 [Stenotrophomonas phage A1432]UTC27962.1 hypothetical protein [Stenotrophomonas phage A1432]